MTLPSISAAFGASPKHASFSSPNPQRLHPRAARTAIDLPAELMTGHVMPLLFEDLRDLVSFSETCRQSRSLAIETAASLLRGRLAQWEARARQPLARIHAPDATPLEEAMYGHAEQFLARFGHAGLALDAWGERNGASAAVRAITRVRQERSAGLDLDHLGLEELPPVFSRLSFLYDIDLTCNGLRSLPADFASLANLTSLSISCNSMTEWPPVLFDLSQLTVLQVTGNELPSPPRAIGRLTRLTMFEADQNRFTSLPEELFSLERLEVLGLGDNAIEWLSPSIGRLFRLDSLDLRHNRLRSLPREIGDLAFLRDLYLQNNDLGRLPNGLGYCRALEALNVSHNDLRNLPPTFGQLMSLEHLNLAHNRLLRPAWGELPLLPNLFELTIDSH